MGKEANWSEIEYIYVYIHSIKILEKKVFFKSILFIFWSLKVLLKVPFVLNISFSSCCTFLSPWSRPYNINLISRVKQKKKKKKESLGRFIFSLIRPKNFHFKYRSMSQSSFSTNIMRPTSYLVVFRFLVLIKG